MFVTRRKRRESFLHRLEASKESKERWSRRLLLLEDRRPHDVQKEVRNTIEDQEVTRNLFLFKFDFCFCIIYVYK